MSRHRVTEAPSGEELCYECDGRRTCNGCDGDGRYEGRPCFGCGGDGKCWVCRGFGTLAQGTHLEVRWGRVSNAAARALRSLAARHDDVPELGGFDPIEEVVAVEHPSWRCGRVVLRIGALPEPPPSTAPSNRRYLQVRVATPSGGSETSQLVATGTKLEVMTEVSRPSKSAEIVKVLRDLCDVQRSQNLP